MAVKPAATGRLLKAGVAVLITGALLLLLGAVGAFYFWNNNENHVRVILYCCYIYISYQLLNCMKILGGDQHLQNDLKLLKSYFSNIVNTQVNIWSIPAQNLCFLICIFQDLFRYSSDLYVLLGTGCSTASKDHSLFYPCTATKHPFKTSVPATKEKNSSHTL